MKKILVDPNLVRTFLVTIFLILIMVRTPENNYSLVRIKLGYLRYILFRMFLFLMRTLSECISSVEIFFFIDKFKR